MAVDLNDYFKKNNSNNNNSNNNSGGGNQNPPFEPPQFFQKNATWIIAILIVIVLAIVAKPFVVIQEGTVGILSTLGKYENTPLKPGMHFFTPFIQKVIVIDTKVHQINYKRTTSVADRADSQRTIKLYPPINVLDARGLPITIELSISYRIDPLQAPYVIKTYGYSWEDKIVNPLVRDIVRNVIGRFPGEELPTKRNAISTLIESQIRKGLDQVKHKPVILTSVQLREIVLPTKIKEQIENVQVAKQESERVKYEVLRAKQEAQKRAALAQGVADAAKIRAQGIADATLIKASANAKANILISKSLTNNLLRLKQIETQNQFNKALAVNKDAKIFLTPGGVVPNIWVDTKDSKQVTSTLR